MIGGVVIENRGAVAKVRLENGAEVNVINKGGFKFGEAVHVALNLNNWTVVDIRSAEKEKNHMDLSPEYIIEDLYDFDDED